MANIQRRAFITSASALMAGAAVPGAIAATSPDAELLRLEPQICEIDKAADRFRAEVIEPHEDEFQRLLRRRNPAYGSEAAERDFAEFEARTGRDAAVDRHNAMLDQRDDLLDRMWSIPAQTQAGRAAKVRVLMQCHAGDDWHGEDPDSLMALYGRRLLGEFAGMTEAELAAL